MVLWQKTHLGFFSASLIATLLAILLSACATGVDEEKAATQKDCPPAFLVRALAVQQAPVGAKEAAQQWQAKLGRPQTICNGRDENGKLKTQIIVPFRLAAGAGFQGDVQQITLKLFALRQSAEGKGIEKQRAEKTLMLKGNLLLLSDAVEFSFPEKLENNEKILIGLEMPLQDVSLQP